MVVRLFIVSSALSVGVLFPLLDGFGWYGGLLRVVLGGVLLAFVSGLLLVLLEFCLLGFVYSGLGLLLLVYLLVGFAVCVDCYLRWLF